MSSYAGVGFGQGLENATNTLLQIQMYKQKMAHEDKINELKQKHEDAQEDYWTKSLQVKVDQGDINADIKLKQLEEKSKIDDALKEVRETEAQYKKFTLHAIEEQAKADHAAAVQEAQQAQQGQGQPQGQQQGVNPVGFMSNPDAVSSVAPQPPARWIAGANGPRQVPQSGITQAQDQRTWSHIVDKTDPLQQSSRSGIGMAVNANIRANRALTLLNKKDMTPQEMETVSADLAGIFQGGAPTQIGMHDQEYNTLQKTYAGIVQHLTANPQDAASPQIKERLIGVVNGLKKLDSGILDDHINYMEKAYKSVISKHKDEWEGMKENLRGSSVMQTGDEGKDGGKNKYSVNQVITAPNGKKYKVTGGDMNNPNIEEMK